jgi:Protein RETICULATA-related
VHIPYRCIYNAQVAAEYEKRRENFFKEFDFVLADILTSCFANFAAVWSSCPTMTIAGAADGAAAAAASSKG